MLALVPANGDDTHPSYYYGEARLIFSTKGYKDRLITERKFVFVKWYSRVGKQTHKGSKSREDDSSYLL